jgi:hypothetical protein
MLLVILFWIIKSIILISRLWRLLLAEVCHLLDLLNDKEICVCSSPCMFSFSSFMIMCFSAFCTIYRSFCWCGHNCEWMHWVGGTISHISFKVLSCSTTICFRNLSMLNRIFLLFLDSFKARDACCLLHQRLTSYLHIKFLACIGIVLISINILAF